MKRFTVIFLALSLFSTLGVVSAAPPPAIEMTSLLECFKLHHKSGRLELNARSGANGAFIPPNAKVQVAISKRGSNSPLVSHPVRARSLGKVWSNIQVAGSTHYQFTEAGDYTITYFVNGKPATSFDFTVTVQSSDDPFAPDSTFFVNGPWNDLALLQVVNGKPSTPLTFKFFTRQETAQPDNNMKATVELFHEGELIALANPGGVAWSEWSLKEFDFSFPVEQGGRKFTFADLVKNDGDYTITVKLDGQLYGHYAIKVTSGKVAPHTRQLMSRVPSTEWLVPRRNSSLDSADPIYYLTRSTQGPVTSAAPVADVSESRRDGWEIIPNADPKRPFELVHTKIQTRRDTPLAAGDGIVAFATGRQGVAYFRVGEDKQRSIPNGQQYRGDLFHVCGKLIVLANRNNLFVHDTVSGRTEAIEDSDVHLRYRKGALFGPRYVDADGYLVATVNEPTKVRDRSVIKVLDLSGDEPQVVSLRGSLTVDDVSSVAVSAKHGYVAVGSKRKQAIFVAKVAPGAKLKKFDVSGYDSFGEMDMALLDRYVVYQDAAGFSSIRALDLDSGSVITPDYAKHGGSWGTTVATNGHVVTWPTRDPHATFVVSDYFKRTSPLVNSGEQLSPNSYSGKFGQGNSITVAHEGTIFLAGSQSISEKRCLQMSMDDRWVAVTGPDAKPIPAIDVVGGDAMVAFKTGKRSTSAPVTISYITYGEQINYTAPSIDVTEDVQTVTTTPAESPAKKSKPASAGPQIDVAKEAYLATTLDSEQQIYEALKPALGEAKARKKAVETAVRALKANGHEDWIADYKERSPLAN